MRLVYGGVFFALALPLIAHEPPPEEHGEAPENHPFDRVEDVEQVVGDLGRRRWRVDPAKPGEAITKLGVSITANQ